ncbi:MAG: hypothetical protein IPL46_01405 [Saprospiraceae bacterium]|nr:hypothetical protein [Saprospiraceae bacterium]
MIRTNAKKEISSVSLAFQKGDVDVNSFVLDQYRRFFSSYSLAFNFRHGHRGPLFLKRFKRVSFDPDRKLASMICYLHHNPIHHGFTSNYSSWKYSSYSRCLEAIGDYELGFSKIIKEYFGDSENYQKLHDNYKGKQKEELDLES